MYLRHYKPVRLPLLQLQITMACYSKTHIQWHNAWELQQQQNTYVMF